MQDSETLWADQDSSSTNSSSDDEECIYSCSSSDAGSKWTVPEARPPRQCCFPYIFRSDLEAEQLLQKQFFSKHDEINEIVDGEDPEKGISLPDLCDATAHTLCSTVSAPVTVPLVPTEEIDEVEKNDDADEDADTEESSSESLESLSSSEESTGDESGESDDMNEETSSPPSTSVSAQVNPNLGKFGNHALLQYHFKKTESPATGQSDSNVSASMPSTAHIHSSSPTSTGHKRKRSHISSTATTDISPSFKRPLFTLKRKIIQEFGTTEERDAYIVQRVGKWKNYGTLQDWKNLAYVVQMPVHVVQEKFTELTGVVLEAIESTWQKRAYRVDLNTEKSQNDYIVKRIMRWYNNNNNSSTTSSRANKDRTKREHWRYIASCLGFSAQQFRDRVNQLVQVGKLDAVHIPSDMLCLQKSRLVPVTTEEKDAYIHKRVALSHRQNKTVRWDSICLRIGCTAQEAKSRYAVLTSSDTIDTIDTGDDPYASAMPTKTEFEIGTLEGQNDYLTQRIQQWHQQKQSFRWKTFMEKLGWSREAVKERVYALEKQNHLDATLVPPESGHRRGNITLDTVEKQDQYILDQVAVAQLNNLWKNWRNMSKKLGWTVEAVKNRYIFLTTSTKVNTESTATISTTTSTNTTATTTATTTDKSTNQDCEVIDLTDAPDKNTFLTTPSTRHNTLNHTFAELATYILHCVQNQSWMLYDNNMSSLWRQLGVELGIRETELEQLWQMKLHTVYVQKYGATDSQDAANNEPEPLPLTQQQSVWLCAQVYAWHGRGRGLWEGLSRVLGYSATRIMCMWSVLTPLEVQYRWIEEAYTHRLKHTGVISNGSRSSSSGTTNNYNVSTNINTTPSPPSPATQSAESNGPTINSSNDTLVASTVSIPTVSLPTLQSNKIFYSARMSHSEQEDISKKVHEYYLNITKSITIGEFWRTISSNPLSTGGRWKQLCIQHPDSELLIPVVSVAEVRGFTPTMDAELIDFIHAMRNRWGKTHWSVIAHGLSTTVDVLRARWFCYLQPQPSLYRHFDSDQNNHFVKSIVEAVVDTVVVCSTNNNRVAPLDADGREVQNLVFDMVNTVSVTASLRKTTLQTIRANTTECNTNDVAVPTTLSISHTSRLSGAEIALIIDTVTAWNAGNSKATTMAYFWKMIAVRLHKKYYANDLSNKWRQLCKYNTHSPLFVWPVASPITSTYVISTVSNVLESNAPQSVFTDTLRDTPAIKERWCNEFSHRPNATYHVLQAQQKTKDSGQSALFTVDLCVEEMIAAVELTIKVDTYLAVPPADSSAVRHSEGLVRNIAVCPPMVSYNTQERCVYLAHYLHRRRTTGMNTCWTYLSTRLKASPESLYQMYCELLRRQEKGKHVENRSTLPGTMRGEDATLPVVMLDPSVIRWHKERVKLPHTTTLGPEPRSHNIQFVGTDGVPISELQERSVPVPAAVTVAASVAASKHLSAPAGDVRHLSVREQEVVQQDNRHQLQHQQQQQQHRHEQQQDLELQQRQEQAQELQRQAILHLDHMILRTVRDARDSDDSPDWVGLSQTLRCPVSALQQRYLYLLAQQRGKANW